MTEASGPADGLLSRIRALSNGTRFRLAKLVQINGLDLSSQAQVRESLGLTTLDAAGLSRAFSEAASSLGRDLARGIALGASLSGPAPAQPQLVWTAPGAPPAARGTAQVAAELVNEARTSAIVVGYSLTSAAARFLGLLADATRRGVACTLVADRMEEKLATLAEHWPKDLGMPPMWTRPEDPNDEKSALHAKFIVIDSRKLLITSANLTYHGFHGNMEMGVLVEGPVAAQAEGLVREWAGAGLIRRVGVQHPR